MGSCVRVYASHETCSLLCAEEQLLSLPPSLSLSLSLSLCLCLCLHSFPLPRKNNEEDAININIKHTVIVIYSIMTIKLKRGKKITTKL